MICSDTSTLVALLAGESGVDVNRAAEALKDGQLVLAPVTLMELVSDRRLPPIIEASVLSIPHLEITPGYWWRAGKLRRHLMGHGYRPKIADTLIAQACLDHHVSLLTRDRDFEGFAKVAGLRLL